MAVRRKRSTRRRLPPRDAKGRFKKRAGTRRRTRKVTRRKTSRRRRRC